MKMTSCALSVLGAVFFALTCNAAETETVAVIGTGDMGDTLGPRFAALGYRVIYGSRDPQSEKVQGLVARTGNAASAAAQAEAAAVGTLVSVAGTELARVCRLPFFDPGRALPRRLG